MPICRNANRNPWRIEAPTKCPIFQCKETSATKNIKHLGDLLRFDLRFLETLRSYESRSDILDVPVSVDRNDIDGTRAHA